MICNVCKKSKADEEFTKINKSKNGYKGLCKECKKLRDKKHRDKKDTNDSLLRNFELIPDLLVRNKNKSRIGVMVLDRIVDRTHFKKGFFQLSNFGLNAILEELQEPYEYCIPEFINNYEFILVSLTSSLDVENLIYNFELHAPEEVKAKIIIGGFGVININLIKPYIDIAVFGRAEGQINEILSGKKFSNVWRKKDDPELKGHYYLRQPKYLVKGENSVGCRNRCSYCQYTWTRRQLESNTKYHPTASISIQETDWKALSVKKAGRYNTAWDGFSEVTRLLVNKQIRDKDIIDKFIEIDKEQIKKTIFLKIFQIVGFPFETEKSVLKDIDKISNLLSIVDESISTNFVIQFTCTPFEPQPLTPLQDASANIDINWNELLTYRKVYYGKNIKAFISTGISGPYSLMKRVYINRANENDLERFKKIAFNSRLKRMPERYKVEFLKRNGYISMEMFSKNQIDLEYLEIEPEEKKSEQLMIE